MPIDEDECGALYAPDQSRRQQSEGTTMTSERSLLDRIRDSLGNLVTLEIATVVGPVRPSERGVGLNPRLADLDVDWGTNPPVILTKIDLLQGDIRTVMDEEFATGEYQALREFHSAREQEGHALIERNIAVLRELYRLAERLASGEGAPAAEPREP